LNNCILKQAYSCGVAVFVATIVAYYFAFSEPFWMVLAAFFVMQTTVGSAVRQGLQYYLVLVGSLILGALLKVVFPNAIILLISVILILSLSQGFLKNSVKIILNRRTNEFSTWKDAFFVPDGFNAFHAFSYLMICTILLLSQFVSSVTPKVMYFRVYDLTLGATIGVIINLLIFPTRVDVVFRKTIMPTLVVYSSYLHAVGQLFFKKPDAASSALQQKIRLEKIFQMQASFFPAWVYEPGLSLTLQSGHRHFIIMVERIGEILFALHQIAKYSWSPDWSARLEAPVTNYFSAVETVFRGLITVLSLQTLSETVSDLKEELIAVEKEIQALLPQSLDLIEMSEEFILLIAFGEQLKDLRITLLNLGNALRSAADHAAIRQ
jgi:hypothetical protein